VYLLYLLLLLYIYLETAASPLAEVYIMAKLLFFFAVQNTRVEFDWVRRESVQSDRPLSRICLQVIPRQTADRKGVDCS